VIRRIFASVVAILLLTLVAAGVDAAEGIRVSIIVKSATGGAIRDARVVLQRGKLKLSALTDLEGRAIIVLPFAGDFEATVESGGYSGIRTRIVIPQDKDQVEISFAQSSIRTIGRVTAKISDPTVTVIDSDSPFGRLSTDFLDLINRLGQVSFSPDNFGRAGDISFGAKDPSTSRLSLDGVDISDPLARGALDPDLIRGAQLNEAAEQVSAFTLSPTPWTELHARLLESGFGGFRDQASVQSTIGQTGIAVLTNARTQHSFRYGETFLDSSGLTYPHRSNLHRSSTLLKLNEPLSTGATAQASFITLVGHTVPFGSVFSGAVPGGEGPNVSGDTTAAIQRVAMQLSGAKHSAQIAFSKVSSATYSDERTRFAGGIAAPQYSVTRGRQYGLNATLVSFVNGAQTLNYNVDVQWTDNTASLMQDASLSAPFFDRLRTRTGHYALSYNAQIRPGFSAEAEVAGATRIGQAARSVRLLSTVHRGGSSAFIAVSSGSTLSQLSLQRPYGDPATAQYDCGSRTIISSAPNEMPSVPSTLDFRLGIQNSTKHLRGSLQAYSSNVNHVTISGAYVPAVALADLPTALTEELLHSFVSLGGCVATAPHAPRLYFTSDVANNAATYRGLLARVTFTPSRAVGVSIAARYEKATFTKLSQRLQGVGSLYGIGRQIPWQPVLNGNVSVVGILDNRTTGLLSSDFSQANNARHLPGYVLLSGGLSHTIGPGVEIDFVASNLLGAFTGFYRSSRYTAPLVTGGEPFRGLSAPLPNPALYIELRFSHRNIR